MNKFIVGAITGAITALTVQTAVFLTQDARAAEPKAAALASAAGPNRQGCSREQEEANKRVLDKIKIPTPANFLSIMHQDYIQHNPDSVRFAEINNTSGKEAMEKLLEAMNKVGYIPGARPADASGKRAEMPPMPAPLIIAECDMVFSMHSMQLPDPQNPGKTYTAYSFDLYRIKDGKLYEHWDGARITNPTPPYLVAPLQDLKPGTAPIYQQAH